MSAQDSESGKFMPCPSCGRTVIVPATSQLPDPPPAKSPAKSPARRSAKRSGKPPVQSKAKPPVRNQSIWLGQRSRDFIALLKKFLIVLVVGAIALGIYIVTQPGWGPGSSFGSSNAEFPPMLEMMVMLGNSEYMSLNADGAIETLDGRRLQRFSYAMSGPSDKRNLRRIDLWCPIGDPNHVVALSSVISSSTKARKSGRRESPLKDLNFSKPLDKDVSHAMSVWVIVSEISGISQADGSRPYTRKGVRGRKYQKSRFSLELYDKTPERQADGRRLYDKWLVLKDRSW